MKTGPKPRPIESRFWEKVDKRDDNECWNWTAKLDKNGYGRIGLGGRDKGMARSPRIAYLLCYGVDPGDQWVLHSCDNPSCVNPKHLRLGSAGDNNKESFDKGRNPNPRLPGESNPYRKLTGTSVKEIRERYSKGDISQQSLAEEYGVDQTCISNIVRRKSWPHVV